MIGEKSVEFLIYTLAAVSMGFVWLKPRRERLAFGGSSQIRVDQGSEASGVE